MERRQYLATIGGTASVLSLAGCSSSDSDGSDGGDETGGSEYEAGDGAEAMLTTDYFGEGWTEQEVEGDSVGEDDGPEFESGVFRSFFSEDETEAVIAAIGIAEDPDTAETITDDYATANIVGGESVDLGDGGQRGEAQGFGVVTFTDSNAGIISLAGREAGLELQPMNGRAYNVGEDLLNNLQEL